MRLFFGALVLNFTLFFNEIEEALGMKRISPKPEIKNNRMDNLVTSSLRAPSYPTYDSTLIAQQALDSSGYHPSSSESFHQKRNGFHSSFAESSHQQNDGYHPHLPQSYHQQSSSEIPDLVKKYGFKYGYPPQGAEVTEIIKEDYLGRKKQESSPEHNGLENTNWLINHFRVRPLPVPRTGFPLSHQHTVVEESDQQSTINPRGQVKGLRAQLQEARGRHRNKELLDLEKKIKEQDVKNMHDMFYPHGSPNPEPQLQFRQQSQLPKHDLQYYDSELTPNQMGGSNSHQANQGYDPNGLHNPHYLQGHPGGSGSGSKH